MTEPEPRPIGTWQEAEERATAWMRDWGFFDAKVTRGGADGGVDVVASKALAQVKWKRASTGRPAVQGLVGARMANQHQQLFFFSLGGFSRQAVEYADKMGVALFRYDALGRVMPMSPAARKVVDERWVAENYRSASQLKFLGAGFVALIAGVIVLAGWVASRKPPTIPDDEDVLLGALMWAVPFFLYALAKLFQGLSIRRRGRKRAETLGLPASGKTRS
jgi:hypothetical protein